MPSPLSARAYRLGERSALRTALLVLIALLAAEAFLFRSISFSNVWTGFFHYLLLPVHNWRFRGAALAFVCLSLFQVVGLLYLAQGLARPARAALLFVVWFAAAFEQSYLGTFGRFSTEQDLAMAWIDTGFQHWRTAIVLYFQGRSLVCGALFLVLLAMPQVRTIRKSALATFAATTLFFYTFAWTLDERLFSFRPFATVSIAAFERSLTAFILSRMTPPIERDPVLSLAAGKPKINVVLIVDESVAGDHLSLNGYGRPTTPYLSQLEEESKLANLGLAVSGTTCSHTSGNLLMTGLRPEEMPATELLQRTPSIFQFAHAAGFKTHFFDGQMTTFWLGTRTFLKGNFGDWRSVDDWRPLQQFEAPIRSEIDQRLALAVRETLARSGAGEFIWVWKVGSHVPYTSCYADAGTIWAPTGDQLGEPISLTTAYDNCLVAAVDHFFETLLKPPHPWLSRTVFLYTSDHGQTLGRGGFKYTHCGSSPLEVVVPLFVIGDPEVVASVRKSWLNAASHENIFASMLDLMDVPLSARPRRYAPSLFEERTGDRRRMFKDANLDHGAAALFPENAIPEDLVRSSTHRNE